MLGRALAIGLLVVSGCKLRVSDVEAGDPDAAPPRVVATADAAPADDSPPDAAPPPADAAPVVQSQVCDEQFGAAAGYVLCGEQPTSCTFFAETAGGTCADQCALFASECVDAFDSSPEAPCTPTSADGCLAAHSTQTCTCARLDASGVGG
ncbi:MAG TPA: hypothetical protein VFU21_21745 [Kofleriaceae bacterium]|nr:hypothetical protein [Kofleriaceae bacterium]